MKMFIATLVVASVAFSSGVRAESAKSRLQQCLVESLGSEPPSEQWDDRVSDAVVKCRAWQNAIEQQLLLMLHDYDIPLYAHARALVGVYASHIALSAANAAGDH